MPYSAAMRLAALFASALAPFLILACAAPRDLGGRTDTGPGGLDPGDGSSIDDGSGPIDLDGGAPYAVFGVQASHGPYTGGTRIEIRGRGFSSKTRVKIGGVEVDPTTVVASDPLHVQVLTPPGEPGPADVEMIDVPTGQTAFLSGGFTYDSFYADPSSGATTGGTLITLTGRGTKWVTGTTATVDGKPCGDLAVKDETHLTCVAPAGTPGVKAISITTPDTVVVSARDAYTYADTTDGYRGGLAGDKLPGELKVIALVNPNGDLLPEATVVVRGSDGSIQTAKTSISGVASFAAPPPAPVTVTITKKCIQPTTFDGVKVRSVTAYLNPVMSVACISPEGEPPPTGGKVKELGSAVGELVWPIGVEFKRGGWKGVPDPKTKTQRKAAYVFAASSSNLSRFTLPSPEQATTDTSPGTVGYQFIFNTLPGITTLYAVAGIEDRPEGKQATFDPYVYGLVRGVGIPGGGVIDRVFIPMTGTFTAQVDHDLIGLGKTARGPDRIRAILAIDVGGGYMLLPNGSKDALLPLGGPVSFVGVPPLLGALASSSYVATVEASTGSYLAAPLTAVNKQKHRIAGKTVSIGPFLALPRITSPAVDKPWDGRTVSFDLPSGVADVIVIGVGAVDGSTQWTIVLPGDTRSVTLPDFSAKPELGLPAGNLIIGVSAAKLDADFSYDSVRYGQLGRSQWTAYAYDTANGYW